MIGRILCTGFSKILFVLFYVRYSIQLKQLLTVWTVRLFESSFPLDPLSANGNYVSLFGILLHFVLLGQTWGNKNIFFDGHLFFPQVGKAVLTKKKGLKKRIGMNPWGARKKAHKKKTRGKDGPLSPNITFALLLVYDIEK